MGVSMIASRPLGTLFQLTGTAATHTSRVRAAAGAAAKSARAPADARALLMRLPLIVLADDELALHPWVDQAHEVMRRALLRGHVEVLGEALLGLDERGVARLVVV